MKITLIQPAIGRDGSGYVGSWKMEPLTLSVLAGQIPPEHEVVFHDDRLEPIPFDDPTDLVAMSTESYTARRSYQIAASYRKRGVPVVIGGYHATLVPEETGQHADAVVLGEAEDLWPELLADAAAGRLKKIYNPKGRPAIRNLKPDRRIYQHKSYMPLALVESGRGCKFSCDFCSISAFYKQSYQYRPPEDVAAEIASTGRKLVFLVDDNIVADFDRARDLCRALRPLGITWISQGTLNIARDPELLREMERSGCAGLLIGFESLSPANLKAMRKSFNQFGGGFSEALARVRGHGIKVYATFVFGYDHDTPDLFERTLDFALEEKFFVAAFNHLQPFPGTALYQRMEQEGRLLHDRWWLQEGVHFGDIIFRPANMSPDELWDRLMNLRRRYFSWSGILRRALDLKANCNGPLASVLYLATNALIKRELDEKWGLPLGDLSIPEGVVI